MFHKVYNDLHFLHEDILSARDSVAIRIRETKLQLVEMCPKHYKNLWKCVIKEYDDLH